MTHSSVAAVSLRSILHALRWATGLGAIALSFACSDNVVGLPLDGLLPLGTWGGSNSGMIVGDTATHLHVACTYGDVSGRIALDRNGRFDVAGNYTLRAFPIVVGPPMPARFVGRVDGVKATVTVTVNDTVEHKTVMMGPVVVTLGAAPQMGPCPICRRPILTRAPRTVSRWSRFLAAIGLATRARQRDESGR